MKPCSHADSRVSGRATLEPLERRILELIAKGLSNREVAEQLGIPVELVQAQLRAIFEKLGASSKLEALLVAVRRGLIQIPPG